MAAFKSPVEVCAPLPVKWKLLRNGKVVSDATGGTFSRPVEEPGNYRVEAWLNVAGEEMIWVLSNLLYIRAARKHRIRSWRTGVGDSSGRGTPGGAVRARLTRTLTRFI